MACALPTKNLCVVTDNKNSREAKELHLHRLMDMTYGKIDELRKLLYKESEILRTNVHVSFLDPVIDKQNELMERVYRLRSNPMQLPQPDSDRIDGVKKHSVSFNLDNINNTGANLNARIPMNPMKERGNVTVDHVDGQQATAYDNEQFQQEKDSSWYGSLDRNFSKKKRQMGLSKKRRHTKTVGSMAGLDIIKRSQELRPDEQYEIGLPRVTSFPASKMASIHATLSHPQLPVGWGPTPRAAYFDSPVVNAVSPAAASPRPPVIPARLQSLGQSQSPHSRQNSGIGIGNGSFEMDRSGYGDSVLDTSVATSSASYYSAKESPEKSWFETSLDENPATSQLSPVMSSTVDSSSGSGVSFADGIEDSFSRMNFSSSMQDVCTVSAVSSKSSETESITGFANESTKPFEMSDYYKYSSKYRTHGQVPSSGQLPPLRSPYLHEPLSAEKREMLIDLFSRDTSNYSSEGDSWITDRPSKPKQMKELIIPPMYQRRLDNEFRTPQSSQFVPDANANRNIAHPRAPYTDPGRKVEKPNDVNGNSAAVPELPPRLRRDVKPVSNLTQSQPPNPPRGPTNDKGAWVMDTPTFV